MLSPSPHRDTTLGVAADMTAPFQSPGVGLSGTSTVDAVIFDYGNVLHAWESMGAVAGRVHMAAWDEFVDSGEFHRLYLLSDAGATLPDLLTDLAAAHPERPDWARMLTTYVEHFAEAKPGPIPGMAPLVDTLLDAGVPLYVLTNYNDRLFAATRWMVPQLERFRGVVVSGEEHLIKPDPAIYRLLLDRYHLEASTTLFIDDSPANIEGAREIGLATHLFRGAGRLRADLIERGVLPAPVD